MPAVPRAAILTLMLKRSLLALPAIAGAALLATRLVPGSLPDGSTLLPSGWRIRPAGRAVPVGTLPLNLVTLSDGSIIVTNDGYGENSLMRIDPVRAQVVWRVPLPAAWLGLARTGRDWRDTVWASGGPTNRVYRFAWQGGASWIRDSVALADSGAKLYPAGLALLLRQGLVAVVGNLRDSVYFIDAATLVRLGAKGMRVAGLIPVGWYPSAVAASADGRTLYVANGKGSGSSANTDGTYIGNVITGSVSIIPVPDSAGLQRYTSQVYALSPFSNARLRPTVRPSDHPPELTHVVYIIRENRTYDQVYGDDARGTGDAC